MQRWQTQFPLRFAEITAAARLFKENQSPVLSAVLQHITAPGVSQKSDI